MKTVVGVICEYDPFHRGHARQFSLIRERCPDALIVCLMSGCFTQRGMPALFSPAFRAKAALEAGASMVLELPCSAAVRDAENFALGGVSIFTRLRFIDRLSFGTENPDLSLLTQAAHLLENPDAVFQATLQHTLAAGKPFAAAQAAGITASLSWQEAADAVVKPNNILGICYLRALERLQSRIRPLPVLREGSYHSPSLSPAEYPSASAVRKAFLAGQLSAAEDACGYPLHNTAVHRPEALDTVLLNTLRSLPADALRQLPDCSEGLENRIKQNAVKATSRTELLSLLKTRRYTRTRLNRLLTHALLGMQADLLQAYPMPSYVRLLGFRRENQADLALLKQTALPVIARPADGDTASPLYQLDERAYDLWALGAKLPAGLMYRQQMVII